MVRWRVVKTAGLFVRDADRLNLVSGSLVGKDEPRMSRDGTLLCDQGENRAVLSDDGVSAENACIV